MSNIVLFVESNHRIMEMNLDLQKQELETWMRNWADKNRNVELLKINY